MIYYVGATWWSLIIEYQLGIKNKPCLTDGYETGTKYKDLRCTLALVSMLSLELVLNSWRFEQRFCN